MGEKFGEFDMYSWTWSDYCKWLKIYFESNKTPEDLKAANLISAVGSTTSKLIGKLCSPSKPADVAYDKIVQIVEDHLKSNPFVKEERHKFHQTRQREKTIERYADTLKKNARFCNFGEREDECLQEQFSSGLRSETIRHQLHRTAESLTFYEFISIASKLEADENKAAKNKIKKTERGTSLKESSIEIESTQNNAENDTSSEKEVENNFTANNQTKNNAAQKNAPANNVKEKNAAENNETAMNAVENEEAEKDVTENKAVEENEAENNHKEKNVSDGDCEDKRRAASREISGGSSYQRSGESGVKLREHPRQGPSLDGREVGIIKRHHSNQELKKTGGQRNDIQKIHSNMESPQLKRSRREDLQKKTPHNGTTQTMFVWQANTGFEIPAHLHKWHDRVTKYTSEGRLEMAVGECKQKLADMKEITFGHNDPDIATVLNILASIYREQWLYEEAFDLLDRALRILNKEFGDKSHPSVVATYKNLAQLHEKQGKYRDVGKPSTSKN